MAESVVKLRLDSVEYDSKIKRAGENVRNFGDECRKAGQSVANADKETVDYVRSLGQMDTVAKNTKGQLRELTQTVTDMTMQYRALTDEERSSPFGQAMAQSIQELTDRAGNARDAMGDVSAAINNVASDTRVFDQLSAGATFVTSSFQTLQGAAKLVGIEMGDNVEVLAKLQAAMAVTNGLATIQNALQKQSALMQGVIAARTALATAAQTAFAAATGSATAAQAAFNAVANLNPYVMLATAVIAVGTAMIAFGESTDEATEAEKRQQEETERLQRMQENFSNGMRESLGKAVVDVTSKFMSLQDEWRRLKSVGEQKAWIDNNQSSFRALGLSVNDVNSAYNVFIKQAPAVIEALQAIAEAKALEEFRKEQMHKFLQMKYFTTDEGRSVDNGGLIYTPHVGDRISMEELKASGAWDLVTATGKTNAMGRPTYRKSGFQTHENLNGFYYTLDEAGVELVRNYRSRQANALHGEILKGQQSLIDRVDRDWEAAKQKAANLSKNLPFLNGGLNAYSSGGFAIGRGGGRGGGGGTGHGSGGNTTNEQKSEFDLNSDKIKKLTEEYVNATEERKTAIQGEIKVLQDRNAEIQAMKDEALGKVTGNTNAYGSESYFEKEISDLQAALKQATTKEDRAFIQESIDYMQRQLHELVGGVEKPTGNAIGSWISGLQKKLSNTVVGSEQSYKLNEQLLDTQLLQNTLNYALANDITISPDSVESIWEQIIGGENVPDSVWEVLQATINDILAEKGLDPVKLNTKTGGVDNQPKEEEKEQKVLGDYLGEMAGGISSITGGLEDLGIKVPDGISKVVKYLQATQAILTGISTVVTVIMAIQSAKAVPIIGIVMAGGGVVRGAGGLVGGRSFSGDNVPALLNSGEVVLNRAEAGVIANALNNGGIGDLNLSAEVSAEKLLFVLNNRGHRTGRGEIAYSH